MVLTVSDGVSAGEARWPERRRSRGHARRGGLRGTAPRRSRRAPRDRRERFVSWRRPRRSCSRPAARGSGPRDVTPEVTTDALDHVAPGTPRRCARTDREDAARLLSRGVAGRGLDPVTTGSPGGARDGFEVLRPRPVPASPSPGSRLPTARHDDGRVRYLAALPLARQVLAHDLRSPSSRTSVRFRLVDGVPGGGDPVHHCGHGRGAQPRDGAEPADRRRHRRAQPAHGRPRASERCALHLWHVAFFLASLRSPHRRNKLAPINAAGSGRSPSSRSSSTCT